MDLLNSVIIDLMSEQFVQYCPNRDLQEMAPGLTLLVAIHVYLVEQMSTTSKPSRKSISEVFEYACLI